MTRFIRRSSHVSSSRRDDRDLDEYNVEYSFAMEYRGPPVAYDVPRVVPIDVDRIPTATAASRTSALSNLSLPVIQPIVKSNPVEKRPSSNELRLGPERVFSATHSGEFDASHGTPSCKSVSLVGRESELRFGDNDSPPPPKVSDGVESSGTLGFSDSHDDSRELSGSSDLEDFHDEDCNAEEGEEEASRNGNRKSTVTFRDSETIATTIEETGTQAPRSKSKKGLCHRCLKGNRFTEKEICVVCSAKYCSNCVLRAMGSMPEGRKCITCIGFPVDESKRGSLGKCSRMLKRLLTVSEVKQIMSFEISCEANQLPPNLVFVNGKPLCHEELILLKTCSNPPKKLRPGRYWYDKVSGFWGKEGQKPCQIISSQLAVGDSLKVDASNGNTTIQINGREITKSEFWMLHMAGIRCEGNTHYWVGDDGAYQEEGQKNVLGKIWDKTGIKLLCAMLSLPIPPESEGGEVDNAAGKVDKTINKFLLLGYDQSGTSTLFKQAKIIYDVPFSDDERQNIKSMIQSNLYGYLAILLEGRERFEEEFSSEMRKKFVDQPGPSGIFDQIEEKNIYTFAPKLKQFSSWLLQIMMSGNLEAIFPAATRTYAPLVEEVLKDKAFQATYDRRNELHMLPRVANYFLDRAVEISREDYEPSDMDILYAEGITSSNGLASTEFSFPKTAHEGYMDSIHQTEFSPRYQLIRVHSSSLGENCKWLEMFEDADLIIFCVSLTDYDDFFEDSNGIRTNKMIASRNLFETIVTHPIFAHKNFLLLLNKFDLLEEKIEEIPLNRCEWFQDFNPVIGYHPKSRKTNNNASLAQSAFHYVGAKFKTFFYSLTERKLFVSSLVGLEPDSVDDALRYGREIIKWDDEKPHFSTTEWSSGSIEASSSS